MYNSLDRTIWYDFFVSKFSNVDFQISSCSNGTERNGTKRNETKRNGTKPRACRFGSESAAREGSITKRVNRADRCTTTIATIRPIVLIAREDERCRDVTGPRLMMPFQLEQWTEGGRDAEAREGANNRVKENRDSRGESSESEGNEKKNRETYIYKNTYTHIYISLVGSFPGHCSFAFPFALYAHGPSCHFSSSLRSSFLLPPTVNVSTLVFFVGHACAPK